MCYDTSMTGSGETDQETVLEQMPFSTEEWAQTPLAVQEFVLSLVVRVQTLEAEVAALREQLNRNSRNSSQPPSNDGPEVPKPHRRAKSGRKRGAQPGHKGTTRKLVAIEQVKESLDVKAHVCRRCGHALEGADAEPHRHQVTEVPPIVAEVTEYRLHTLTCTECHTKTRAELPAGVPQGAFGPRLQAMVSLLSGRYRLSKRETADVMADFFQADMSLGSVSALEQRTSQAIREPVEEAREYVKTQPVVNMDETDWREANQKAWLWVAATPLVTVFRICRSRGGKVSREMLGEAFRGIVGSDRWSAYNWLITLLRQLCWAHLLRDFQAFVERGTESQRIGEALLAQADLMFKWWHKMRDGTMDRATFQEQMQPVQREVGELLRQGTNCDHSKTAGTCRDILKREEALWTFVRVAGVEPTNNLAERQVRPGVLWRKNSFGTQSETGSRFAERIMSVVATLKQQHRNALDYLTQVCDAANWGKQPPSLLPADVAIAR
jgi:transposase